VCLFIVIFLLPHEFCGVLCLSFDIQGDCRCLLPLQIQLGVFPIEYCTTLEIYLIYRQQYFDDFKYHPPNMNLLNLCFTYKLDYLLGGLNTVINEKEVEGLFNIIDLLKILHFLFEFIKNANTLIELIDD